jgi:hypothetical protein
VSPTGRTQRCSEAHARTRLEHARAFRQVADLIEDAGPEFASAAAAVAVLAGVAACDAACCKALGRRSRGPDHHEAEGLVRQVEPGGKVAATALGRLLDLKDAAHYGLFDVSGSDLRTAIRQADKLVTFAESIVAR